MVFVVDFVENNNFEVQNEVQSMHWHSYHVTILVHITWQHILDVDPHDEISNVVMKYHFYISNEKSHDSYFLLHSLLLHWQNVLDGGFHSKTIGYGQMGTLPNLRAKPHGFLLFSILI